MGRILLALQAETLGYADHVRTDLLLVEEGRGILAISAKCFQTNAGFKAVKFLSIVVLF